jgi:hypothetical protein
MATRINAVYKSEDQYQVLMADHFGWRSDQQHLRFSSDCTLCS